MRRPLSQPYRIPNSLKERGPEHLRVSREDTQPSWCLSPALPCRGLLLMAKYQEVEVKRAHGRACGVRVGLRRDRRWGSRMGRRGRGAGGRTLLLRISINAARWRSKPASEKRRLLEKWLRWRGLAWRPLEGCRKEPAAVQGPSSLELRDSSGTWRPTEQSRFPGVLEGVRRRWGIRHCSGWLRQRKDPLDLPQDLEKGGGYWIFSSIVGPPAPLGSVLRSLGEEPQFDPGIKNPRACS